MATYKIDTAHSEIGFKVKHLMITNVNGVFSLFDAQMTAEKEDFSDAVITFKADVNSVNTNNQERDNHLRSADFFDIEKYPELSFVSKSFKKVDDDEYELNGDLTIRNVVKPVKLKVEYGGTMIDPWGQTKVGFEISGKINRKDFGLAWGALTETGGVVVSDEVKLTLNVQMIKQ